MKGKFKKILSVLLCAVMVFTAFSTAFANGEQGEEHVWCDVRPKDGRGNAVITKGKSCGLYVAYNPGNHKDVSLEWSSQGDSCQMELGLQDEESGLIIEAVVTSVTHGKFDVTVKLVASDGTVLDEDTFTVVSEVKEDLDFFEKMIYEFEVFNEELRPVFYLTVLLPALGMPLGIIAKTMEILRVDEEIVVRFIEDYTLWMAKVFNPNEIF